MSTNSASMVKNIVQQHSILSLKGLAEKFFSVWFDRLVYNQIWEDPRVDIEALQMDENSRVLTICSGGCNILNYLTTNPQVIHAVDLNNHHMSLTTLKIQAFKNLPTYQDFFHFFGCANRPENIQNYRNHIREHLTPGDIRYWEGGIRPRIRYFKNGLYNYGAMGYFIRFLHILAKGLAKDPQELVKISNPFEREQRFNAQYAPMFRHWLIKFLGGFPSMLYSLGIPPQQFHSLKKDAENGAIAELYCDRVRRLICQFDIEDNYFAWQAFARKYDHQNKVAIPDYLKQQNYTKIKENLDKVQLHLCSTYDFLKKQPSNSLNNYIFLDSLDWMDTETLTDLWREVERTSMPKSRIIFRTASKESPIEKSLPPYLRQSFIYEKELSEKLLQQDRSAIYGGFHIYSVTV